MSKIILIGFMGSGKTTLGNMLAQELHVPLLDTDAMIESAHHLSINEIFNMYGEPYFRQLEKSILHELSHRKHYVLATGGGLPCFEDNMNLLNHLGNTVYLKASAKELFRRLSKDSVNRPKLNEMTSQSMEIKISELLDERIPVYEQSKFKLSTEGKELSQLLTELKKLVPQM
jgi:shikimate kinase